MGFRDAQPARDPPARERCTACPRHSGYVAAFNPQGMVEIANESNAVIELSFKPGRHVIEGGTFAWITPAEAATDQVRDKLESCIVLGGERASIQDVETSIRQLVEVALRALSPSVNDPFTAMAVIDRLTTSLAKIMQRGEPQCVWTDHDGKVHLLAPRSTFADVVEEAFRQIRQHAKDQPAVLIRLVESMGQLVAQGGKSQREVLEEQIEIVVETGRRNIAQKQDLAALEQRAKLASSGASQQRQS
ncbi:MAG: DUF2254 family protein [Hyphomicrobiales bacterium]